jgi:hypothetical protein
MLQTAAVSAVPTEDTHATKDDTHHIEQKTGAGHEFAATASGGHPYDNFTDTVLESGPVDNLKHAVRKTLVVPEERRRSRSTGSTDFVDVNEYGAVMRVLYFMARNCAGVLGTEGFGDLPLAYQAWVPAALIPCMLQVLMVLLLRSNIVQGAMIQYPAMLRPHAAFVIAALTVFNYDMLSSLTRDTPRQVFLFWNLATPTWQMRVMALMLISLDAMIGIGTYVLGLQALATSQNSGDLLLSTFALHFIVDVDEYVAKLTPNIGAVQVVEVPSNVVMPKYNPSWPGTFKNLSQFVAYGAILSPIVPLGIAIVAYFAVGKRHREV